jgi:hypothetical protein
MTTTTTTRKTTQKTLTVHCKQCRHEWEPTLLLPLPITRAIVVMRGIVAAGCPNCGAHGRNVLCGPTPSESK